MREAFTTLMRSAHHIHEHVYTHWKVRERRVVFTSDLTYQERVFFLKIGHLLTSGELVVYDIGASTGVVSSLAAKLPNVVAVHAFEPVPEAFGRLIERVHVLPKVRCHNVALGDDNRTTPMYVNRFPDSSSILAMARRHADEFPHTAEAYVENVAMVRLDDYVREHGLPDPDVVKIDVQGYEAEVLRGGADTIGRAKYCVLESSLQPLYEGGPLFDDVYRMLREMGFRLVGVADVLVGRSGQHLQLDGVFENESHRQHRTVTPDDAA